MSEKKLKVRVEPFDSENSYYQIFYKLTGAFIWTRLTVASLWDTASICDRDHPVLIADFDEAVERAKSLTIEKVQKHVAEEDAKYEDHMNKLRDKRKDRNKTFEM